MTVREVRDDDASTVSRETTGPRAGRFRLHGKDGKGSPVDPPERLVRYQPLQGLMAQRIPTQRHGQPVAHIPVPRPVRLGGFDPVGPVDDAQVVSPANAMFRCAFPLLPRVWGCHMA